MKQNRGLAATYHRMYAALLLLVWYRQARASFRNNLLRTEGLALPSTVRYRQSLALVDPRPNADGRSRATIGGRVQVIEHFRLENIFRGLGWFPLLPLFGDYYPDLVREFYANMLHKMDKDLPTIISHAKGVRIVLERDCLVSIIGIPNNGNTTTVDLNKRSKDKDPDWNFDAGCSRFNIQHWALDHCRIIYGGDFLYLLPRALAYLFVHTLVQKGGGFSERTTPSSIRVSSSQPVEDDDEAEALDDEEDEAGAQNTISRDAFQT
ncbi:hypothetical protein M9H77_23366 [Catharanthus roseus]|uniref:Uncharacterized protein n=1 Tax=Catharanthus roseus TaxID=4058 RepID=A0ACC0AX78_CATRO|nr:hypothetical protein M9H77_23366 [Catharanthus roseus]